MDMSRPIFPEPPAATPTAAADSRLQPTPDYGSLGTGSGVAIGEAVATGDARTKSVKAGRRPLIALAVGGLFAALLGHVCSAPGPRGRPPHPPSFSQRPARFPT